MIPYTTASERLLLQFGILRGILKLFKWPAKISSNICILDLLREDELKSGMTECRNENPQNRDNEN